jgi:hypothetical protein
MWLLGTGCAGGNAEASPADLRAQLRSAMQREVSTREVRDELSHVLVEAADGGALDRLTRPEVQAAFGPGLACETYSLCQDQGFAGSDWYYPIGHTSDPKIKQLPVLIVGFDPHDNVSRVYTLKTH